MKQNESPIRSITFDKKAQDDLPQWVKEKMKKDRENAKNKRMENIDFTIDQEDLKCLFIACRDVYNSFDEFIQDSEKGYAEYHKRNSDNVEKFGNPKTYSQWINRQIIFLT